LGGSLETLGSGLRDATLLTSLAQVGTGDELHQINLWLAIAGTLINMLGKFFSNLFAADNASVQKALNEHTDAIAQIKGDTTQLSKEVHDKTG
jgi:hypothetical protein